MKNLTYDLADTRHAPTNNSAARFRRWAKPYCRRAARRKAKRHLDND